MNLKNSIQNEPEVSNLIEKGFILGASEDGTLYYTAKKNQYNIEIEQKIHEWLEIVKKSIENSYGLYCRIRKTSKGYYRLTILSKKLYNEILDKRKNYRDILSEPRDFRLGFIQGFFDAEGTVHNKRYSIRVSSKSKQTIHVVKKIVESLGIRTGKIHADKTAFILPMYGKENLKTFSDIVNFRHKEKKDRLIGLISRGSLKWSRDA